MFHRNLNQIYINKWNQAFLATPLALGQEEVRLRYRQHQDLQTIRPPQQTSQLGKDFQWGFHNARHALHPTDYQGLGSIRQQMWQRRAQVL
jgi:hypothetical protein